MVFHAVLKEVFIQVRSLRLIKYYSNKDNPSLSTTKWSCGKQSYDFDWPITIVPIKADLSSLFTHN